MVFTIPNYLKILHMFELLFKPFSLSHPEKMALGKGKKKEKEEIKSTQRRGQRAEAYYI